MANFFKRIFKSEKDEAQRQWAKRGARINIHPLHQISFTFEDPHELDKQDVINISLNGIGFEKKENQNWPVSGSIIKGTLLLNEINFPLSLQVRHVGARTIGTLIQEVSAKLSDGIFRYFSAEFSAVKMQKVKSELLKKDPNGQPHYFFSNSGFELFYVENEKQLINFHLSFFGNFIECNTEGKVEMSVITESNRDEGKPGYKGSALTSNVQVISKELSLAVQKLVHNISDLDPNIRKLIIEKILSKVN